MFTAELEAFSEVEDLPSSFYAFVKASGEKRGVEITNDTRIILFKIKETVDSHHVIFLEGITTVEDIEQRLSQDLCCVELSIDSKRRLKELLEEYYRAHHSFYMRPQRYMPKEDHPHKSKSPADK